MSSLLLWANGSSLPAGRNFLNSSPLADAAINLPQVDDGLIISVNDTGAHLPMNGEMSLVFPVRTRWVFSHWMNQAPGHTHNLPLPRQIISLKFSWMDQGNNDFLGRSKFLTRLRSTREPVISGLDKETYLLG